MLEPDVNDDAAPPPIPIKYEGPPKTIIKSFVTTDELANVTSDYYTKTNDRFNSTQQYENHRSFSSSGALNFIMTT